MLQLDDTTDDINIIEWRIENFSKCNLEEGGGLKCLIITAGNLFNTRWSLSICPKVKQDPNAMGCGLRREDEEVGPEKINIDFEFSLVTFDGVETFKKSGIKEFKRGDSKCFKYVKLDDIFHRKEFLLQSDSLTVKCKLRLAPPKKKPVSHQVLMKKFPIEKVSTRLTLDNYRSISKQNPRILILRGTNAEELLSLKVFVSKDESEKPETSESFLHIVMTKKEAKNPVHVSCWVKLLNKKLDIVIYKEISHLFPKTDETEEWILPYFIDINKQGDGFIEDDTLHLDFDFTICENQPFSLLIEDVTPLKLKDPKETTLMKDLVDLHRTQKFSDVTLRVGDESFPAHKSVLVARSPRFDEIFRSLSKEKTNCENHIVEIGDVDENTMALMLKFIYTDELDDINDESCLLLYSAAQKYQISSLQFKCAKFLRKTLSVKTVYKALLIAEEFQDSELKIAPLDFILQHYLYVFLTPEWQEFTEEHEELANEVMRYVRLKKQQQLGVNPEHKLEKEFNCLP